MCPRRFVPVGTCACTVVVRKPLAGALPPPARAVVSSGSGFHGCVRDTFSHPELDEEAGLSLSVRGAHSAWLHRDSVLMSDTTDLLSADAFDGAMGRGTSGYTRGTICLSPHALQKIALDMFLLWESKQPPTPHLKSLQKFCCASCGVSAYTRAYRKAIYSTRLSRRCRLQRGSKLSQHTSYEMCWLLVAWLRTKLCTPKVHIACCVCECHNKRTTAL